MCKTLSKEVVVEESSVELLVDFIAIKLKKKEASAHWDSLGYDIAQFNVPKIGLMKSNYLKQEVIVSE